MSAFFSALIAFLVAITILVAFHEFGHFWVARRFGVKVLRFSVGFGKPLWRWRDKQNTEFVISAIPLGGYVKMLDKREGPVPDHLTHCEFTQKSLLARFAIVAAGPLFNFIFAVFAYWLMFMIGIVGWVPQIGEIKTDSIAFEAGMVKGEEIIAVDGAPTQTWQQVFRELVKHVGDEKQLTIQTKNENAQKSYYLDLSRWELKGDAPNLIKDLGIELYLPPILPIIKEVLPGEPAAIAGIMPGDRFVEINGRQIASWQDFIDIVINSPHQPLEIWLKRGENTLKVDLTPKLKETNEGETVGFVGVVVKSIDMPESMLRQEQYGVIESFGYALKKTGEYIGLTFKLIGKMITGQIGLNTISGPLTIAQGAATSAHSGFAYYLGFLGLISISLGVINLLPIPILDGGHLFYYCIEFLTRRPVSEKFQIAGFKLGMLFIIFLMLVAFYNDIVRMF